MYEKNYQLAKIFEYLHLVCQIEGGNRFRCDAYRRASKTLSTFPKSVEEIYKERGKEGLKEELGVGDILASKIESFIREGKVEAYERALNRYGEGAELAKVRGIGPTTARKLLEKGINSFEALLDSLEREDVKSLFKKPEEVRKNVLFYLRFRNHFLSTEANMIVKDFTSIYPSAIPTGGYRRGEPLLETFDFALSKEDMSRLKESGRYVDGHWIWGGQRVRIRLHPYTHENLGEVLVRSTGPKEHVLTLERMGNVSGRSEEEIYEKLGLPYIHPYQRLDGEEVSLALEGKLPEPVLPDSLKGDFHVHTKYSDGSLTAEEAVKLAIRHGYTFVALTDHSPSTARGLKVEDIRKKREEVERLRKKYPDILILMGAEVDILPNGSMDYPEDVLPNFDFVTLSIHWWTDGEDVTDRVLKALENPHVHAFSHPTGRILKKRPGYKIDLDKLFRKAEETGKALELNSNPWRVDLTGEALLRGGYEGRIFIGTDVHREWDMDYTYLGCAQACRGRVSKERILNFTFIEDLLK